MCGIAGFIMQDAPADEAALARMLARIAHRGPDGEGRYVQGRAALGHRRLAVIDPAGGAQPMVDGDLVLIFNGEIYNYKALTAELSVRGHRFATRCDSEVLLHGYREWGDALPGHLRGMFAFAVWDAAAGRLFCARDAFGIKPLYYALCADGTLLFGSEIKAFLDHPSFKKELNEAQLPLYLSFQYSPGEDTFFKGVKKLLPAHSLVLDADGLRTVCWQTPDFAPGAPLSPTALERALRDSVTAHLQADVEVAGFLSGGVDSALITALARPARTYTAAYREAPYSEAAPARALARRFGLGSTVCRIGAGDFFAAVPAVQYHADEPLADAAAVPLYLLNRRAAKDGKVLLSGEGADELFGGYNSYRQGLARWALPWPLRWLAGAVAGRLPAGRGVNFLRRLAVPLAARYYGPTAVFTEREKRRLLLRPTPGPTPAALAAPWWPRGTDAVTAMQTVDLHLWLPGDILLKADKMSMAHGIELRVPFLDRNVFALARQLPPAQKVSARRTKLALREVAARLLPARAAQAAKRGFPVPLRMWLRQEPWVSRLHAAFSTPAAAQFFDTALLHRMVDRHRHGHDCWRQLWCVYCFLQWYEQFFESE